MTAPRGPSDLAAFLAAQGIDAQIVPMTLETPTVAAAAAALGVASDQIIKTVLFLVKDEPVLVIARGEETVDRRPIADEFGVGKKQVKLADRDTVLAVTGYAAGGVPPFGHLRPLSTLIDWRIESMTVLYGGGGDDRTLLRVTPAELARVTAGKWLALS
ncbi:MAG: YbaK/EbsC family protein [Anaerolineae bacterium]|jgi:prolyl-tRNA editing enzyme YbaK/EbsC (Cys-tRNA(Pro) deacylase)|nr:YbaK/EbsC family protein [Anaerolineae bacterium]